MQFGAALAFLIAGRLALAYGLADPLRCSPKKRAFASILSALYNKSSPRGWGHPKNL
jgi:hypothetical protein